jgi:radical SAM protein with 4Fe4S-binding SPASM domain
MDLPIDRLNVFLDHWDETVKASGLAPVVSLTGGDPLLYPYLDELVARLRELDIPFMLKTNSHSVVSLLPGLAFSPAAIKMTIPVPIPDGRDADTLSDLREATAYLHGLGIPVIWHASVYDGNMSSLLDIIASAGEYSPLTLSIGRILPYSDTPGFSVTPSLYRDFLTRLLEIYQSIFEKSVVFRFRESLWMPLLDSLDLLPKEKPAKPRRSCDCYASQLSVDRYGSVYPCGLIRRTVLGSIDDSPEYLFALRKATMDPRFSKCSGCPYFDSCGGCAGASQTITGSCFEVDPHCWYRIERNGRM